MAEIRNIGFPAPFRDITQLYFTESLQVLSRVPGAKTHLVGKRIEPISSDTVLTITPTTTFAHCPQLDVICVPVGLGTDALLNDEETLDFLRKQAKPTQYVTPKLHRLDGAGGGRPALRPPRHHPLVGDRLPWLARRNPGEDARLHRRYPITGGGVTAGLDFGLMLAEKLSDRTTAGDDPAHARIQSRAAVQFKRLAGNRACGGDGTAGRAVRESRRRRHQPRGRRGASRGAREGDGVGPHRHCERSEAIQRARSAPNKKRGIRSELRAFCLARFARAGLLRRFAPRNDGEMPGPQLSAARSDRRSAWRLRSNAPGARPSRPDRAPRGRWRARNGKRPGICSPRRRSGNDFQQAGSHRRPEPTCAM